VRREALPVLEDVLGGGVAEALARTAELLREDADALDAWAARVLDQLCAAHERLDGTDPPVGGAKPAELPVDGLAELPTAVRTRVLRRWAAAAGAGPLTVERTAALDALVSDWHGQAHVELPGGVRVRRASGRLVVCPS
jgi:tRNA(Ile)-lysidine synthase